MTISASKKWDKTKIHVKRQQHGVVSSYAGGLAPLERPGSGWYVVYWTTTTGSRWVYRECRNHATAVKFAATVAQRARGDARTSGTWDLAKAADAVAKDWREAATPVAVAL